MDPITIRPACEQDAPGLAQVQINSYLTAYSSIFPPSYLDQFTFQEQEQDWRGLMDGGTAEKVLVAANMDRELVGYALVRPEAGAPGTPLAPFTAELAALHVRKQDQGRGVGRRLISAAAAWLCDQGKMSVFLTVLERNERARRLYANLGGQFLGEVKRFDVDGWEIVEVAYAWLNVFHLIHQSPVNLHNIAIQPMQPDQLTAARRVILSVVHDNFGWEEPLDETMKNIEEEGWLYDVTDFVNHYNGRGGLFLVALNADQQIIGTGAVRPWSGQTCELKRMWLLPPYQGHGIGLRMLNILVDHARNSMGCKTMLLNTDTESERAIQFYHQFGFKDIPRYTDEGGDIAMHLDL